MLRRCWARSLCATVVPPLRVGWLWLNVLSFCNMLPTCSRLHCKRPETEIKPLMTIFCTMSWPAPYYTTVNRPRRPVAAYLGQTWSINMSMHPSCHSCSSDPLERQTLTVRLELLPAFFCTADIQLCIMWKGGTFSV